MLNVFIGWDDREQLAYHVLSHSIITRCSEPVTITPVKRSQLVGVFDRPRSRTESTDFSISRFLVPWMSQYQGYSIFMDCDMLVVDDLTRVLGFTSPNDAVSVCKHSYTPRTDIKMDGQIQTKYERKNWSSFMVFNNAKCRALTPEVVNTDTGLDLHYFKRLNGIGELPVSWNWLVGEYPANDEAHVYHYTLGGPWIKGYENCDNANLWLRERDELWKK